MFENSAEIQSTSLHHSLVILVLWCIQEAKVVESGSSAGSTTSTKVGNSTGCDCNIFLNLMLTWRLHPCYDHHSRGIIFGRLGDTSFHSIFRFHTHFQVTMQAEFILHSNTGFSYFKCWFHIHMSHIDAFCSLSRTEGHLVATHFHPGITRFWIANERPIFLQSWFYVSHMNEVGTLPWNWKLNLIAKLKHLRSSHFFLRSSQACAHFLENFCSISEAIVSNHPSYPSLKFPIQVYPLGTSALFPKIMATSNLEAPSQRLDLFWKAGRRSHQ